MAKEEPKKRVAEEDVAEPWPWKKFLRRFPPVGQAQQQQQQQQRQHQQHQHQHQHQRQHQQHQHEHQHQRQQQQHQQQPLVEKVAFIRVWGQTNIMFKIMHDLPF